jgi:hypothetical protein
VIDIQTIIIIIQTPSSMAASANMVEGDISGSLFRRALSRLSPVSCTPAFTSQNLHKLPQLINLYTLYMLNSEVLKSM